MSLSIFLNHVFSNSTQYLNLNFLCSPSLKLFPSLSLSPPKQILKIVFTFEVVAFGDAAVAASAAAAFAVAASESVDDEEYA